MSGPGNSRTDRTVLKLPANKLVELRDREIVVGTVLQFDIELKVLLKASLREIAGTGDDSSCDDCAIHEGHDVEFRVQVVGRISADFELARPNPLKKTVDAPFNFGGIIGMLHLTEDGCGKPVLCVCVR